MAVLIFSHLFDLYEPSTLECAGANCTSGLLLVPGLLALLIGGSGLLYSRDVLIGNNSVVLGFVAGHRGAFRLAHGLCLAGAKALSSGAGLRAGNGGASATAGEWTAHPFGIGSRGRRLERQRRRRADPRIHCCAPDGVDPDA